MMKKLIILLVLIAFVAACGCTTTYNTAKVIEKKEYTTKSMSIINKVPHWFTHYHHDIVTDNGTFGTSEALYDMIEIGRTYNFTIEDGSIAGIN